VSDLKEKLKYIDNERRQLRTYVANLRDGPRLDQLADLIADGLDMTDDILGEILDLIEERFEEQAGGGHE